MKLRIPGRVPAHPGEILLDDYLIPLEMSQTELARRLGISYPRVNEIINRRRGVTPDTAIRLARLFNTTPELWLNAQLAWDLYHAFRQISRDVLEGIEPMPQRR